MRLDYFPSTEMFGLIVPRSDAELVRKLQKEDGLDFSATASTAQKAVMIPNNIYAACAYADYAGPEAAAKLRDLKLAIDASWATSSKRKIIAPDGLDLWPFQKAGVEYAVSRLGAGCGALIGDEPGLGKTPTSICIANEMRAKRILVVCPANIRLQWAKQIRAWSVMEGRYIVYPILKSGDGVHPRAEWTIISYDLLRSKPIHMALLEQRFDLIILDEAHYLKTPHSRRTVAVFGETGIHNVAGNILTLTGTPLPNRPRECYTIARALNWMAIDFMSEKNFHERFNPIKVIDRKNSAGRIVGRAKREMVGRAPELQARLRANFMVRRLKRDVLDQLPDIRHEIIHVEETGDVRKALEAEKMLDIDPENMQGLHAEVLGHISVVRHMMGVAKAPQVASYADYVLDGGEEKLVIFGWHIEVLDILERALHKWGIVRVDGRTSPARRQLSVDQFVADPHIKVFLGNLQSVGVGVDGLQKVCNRAIFAESSWTWADNDQGIGRLERIGQHSGILIEFMVAPNSFDERVLGTSLRKLHDIHAVLDKRNRA